MDMDKTVEAIYPNVVSLPLTLWAKLSQSTTKVWFSGGCSTVVTFLCNIVARGFVGLFELSFWCWQSPRE